MQQRNLSSDSSATIWQLFSLERLLATAQPAQVVEHPWEKTGEKKNINININWPQPSETMIFLGGRVFNKKRGPTSQISDFY